jgi:hypothetical protein
MLIQEPFSLRQRGTFSFLVFRVLRSQSAKPETQKQMKFGGLLFIVHRSSPLDLRDPVFRLDTDQAALLTLLPIQPA